MKLHGSAISPFVQRVLMAARVKGIAIELVPLPRGGLEAPEFAAISPTRRIPVLEEDDGWTMVESGAMVAYLEATRPGPSLVPADPRDGARARSIEAIFDIDIGPGMRHFVKQKWQRLYTDESRLDYGRDRIACGLDAFERIGPGDGEWLAGDRPSIADLIAIPVMMLGLLISESSDVGPLVTGRPAVDAWWARASATPLGAQAIGDMRASFEKIFARKG